MAQRSLGARRRFARVASIGGLFLLSMIFAALPVAADKHGGDHGSGDNHATTSQKHDGDDHAKDMVDNDANEHQGVADDDANDNNPGAVDDDDANDHDANDEVNDNDDDDAPPAMVAPLNG